MTYHTDRDNRRSREKLTDTCTMNSCYLHISSPLSAGHMLTQLFCVFHTSWHTHFQLLIVLLHRVLQSSSLSHLTQLDHKSVELSSLHFTELLSHFHWQQGANPAGFLRHELWVAPYLCNATHTRTHTTGKKKTCVLAADPPWRLIPPHFLRPLLLSNWGSGEYNYGENHPGLMWGRINGIKKIICWPSGPTAVWGWEGNLKPKEKR